MRITRIIVASILLVLVLVVAVAQDEGVVQDGVATPPQQDGVATPQVDPIPDDNNRFINNGTTIADLQEISVELFEDPTFWSARISTDYGVTVHQRFDGGPNAKTPLEVQPANVNFDDSGVIGLKTEFTKRGFTEIVFTPSRPIAIPGFVQELSVWVVGRELPHDLYFRLRDLDGVTREMYVGELNFRGWERVTLSVPGRDRLSNNVVTGPRQFDPRQPLNSGLELISIVIKPLYTEAYGTYYVYFDDLRALTDLSVITRRDPDDPVDAW